MVMVAAARQLQWMRCMAVPLQYRDHCGTACATCTVALSVGALHHVFVANYGPTGPTGAVFTPVVTASVVPDWSSLESDS